MYGGQMYAARSLGCPIMSHSRVLEEQPDTPGERPSNAFNIHGHFQQTAMYRVNLLILTQ